MTSRLTPLGTLKPWASRGATASLALQPESVVRLFYCRLDDAADIASAACHPRARTPGGLPRFFLAPIPCPSIQGYAVPSLNRLAGAAALSPPLLVRIRDQPAAQAVRDD